MDGRPDRQWRGGARCDRVTFACAGLSLSAVTMTTELQLRRPPTPEVSDWEFSSHY